MPFVTLVFFFEFQIFFAVLFHVTYQSGSITERFCDKLQMCPPCTLAVGGLLHVCCGWDLAV